jgi:RNA polymerase sigma-70 factor (ECF subfamily)
MEDPSGGEAAEATAGAASGAAAAETFKRDLIAMIPTLRAAAMALTRSRAQSDDMVQETLLRAWRARASFTPGTNLKSWLFTILRHAFFTEARTQSRNVQDSDGALTAALSAPADQEWRLRYGEMLEALYAMHPRAREALILVAAGGLSYEEAAAVCHCPVGTMKSRVNRAREELARRLDGIRPQDSALDRKA